MGDLNHRVFDRAKGDKTTYKGVSPSESDARDHVTESREGKDALKKAIQRLTAGKTGHVFFTMESLSIDQTFSFVNESDGWCNLIVDYFCKATGKLTWSQDFGDGRGEVWTTITTSIYFSFTYEGPGYWCARGFDPDVWDPFRYATQPTPPSYDSMVSGGWPWRPPLDNTVFVDDAPAAPLDGPGVLTLPSGTYSRYRTPADFQGTSGDGQLIADSVQPGSSGMCGVGGCSSEGSLAQKQPVPLESSRLDR